jgi:hypothetical protein
VERGAERERGAQAEAGMSGQRADGKRDRKIAAAYVSGLSLAGCAVKFRIGRESVRGALKRTGTPTRGLGAPRKLDARGDAAAAALHAAGSSVNEAAVLLGVSVTAVKNSLRRQGAQVRSRTESMRLRHERARGKRGEYPWAVQAGARHLAGEPVGRLAREYRTGWRTVKAAIERQGVTVMRDTRGRPPGGAG